jgi:hypothetical protein
MGGVQQPFGGRLDIILPHQAFADQENPGAIFGEIRQISGIVQTTFRYQRAPFVR